MENVSPLAALLAEKNIKRIELAKAMGVNRALVTYWCKNRVPDRRCLEVAKFLGINPFYLRPDVYPAPGEGKAERA